MERVKALQAIASLPVEERQSALDTFAADMQAGVDTAEMEDVRASMEKMHIEGLRTRLRSRRLALAHARTQGYLSSRYR